MSNEKQNIGTESFQERLAELVRNLEFMEKKLDKARSMLKDIELLEPGLLQGEVRTNAAFDAYKSLLASYCKAVSELRQLVAKLPNNPVISDKMKQFEHIAKTMRKTSFD